MWERVGGEGGRESSGEEEGKGEKGEVRRSSRRERQKGIRDRIFPRKRGKTSEEKKCARKRKARKKRKKAWKKRALVGFSNYASKKPCE